MEQFNYIAASVRKSDSNKELGIEGFIRYGNAEEAKKYLKEKQSGSSGTVKIYKLVEVDVK